MRRLSPTSLLETEVDETGFGIAFINREIKSLPGKNPSFLIDRETSGDRDYEATITALPFHYTNPKQPIGMHFAVCGLHLRGGPLNHQLVTVGGKFVRSAMTSPDYKMYALSDALTPFKPGLVLYPGGAPGSASLPVEVWDMPDESIGGLLNFVPSPLGFGTVILDDGEKVKGFVCEGWAADQETASIMGVSSVDITAYGGWKPFVEKDMGKEETET